MAKANKKQKSPDGAAKKPRKEAGLAYQPKPNSGAKAKTKVPKPKHRGKLGKGSRRVSTQAKAEVKKNHSEPLFRVPELADKSQFTNEVLSNVTLYINEQGLPSLIQGFRVIPWNEGQSNERFNLFLGEKGTAFMSKGENQIKIGLDTHYKPELRQEFVPDATFIHYYMEKSRLRLVTPREQSPFYVFSSHTYMGLQNKGRILLRVLTKHVKTPRLIDAIEKLQQKRVLFCGRVFDFLSADFAPDMLILLEEGEELKLETKAGNFVVRNEGQGKASVESCASQQFGSVGKSGFQDLVGLKIDPLEKAPEEAICQPKAQEVDEKLVIIFGGRSASVSAASSQNMIVQQENMFVVRSSQVHGVL